MPRLCQTAQALASTISFPLKHVVALPPLPRRRAVTVCVAGLCDGGKGIILVADKMIGMGMIEAEPEIKKIIQIHRNWWVLIAGNDIAPVFDILDTARSSLQRRRSDVATVMAALEGSYQQKRLHDAESVHLKTIGWTLERFNREGYSTLPQADQIQKSLREFFLDIELLVAGFGPEGKGHIFVLDGGVAKRCDLPGFATIGTGGRGVLYMMYYRKYSASLKAREALYYCIEGKYFGELAPGVGLKTDAYIIRPDRKPIVIEDEPTIEKKIMGMCGRLSPHDLRPKDLKVLNTLKELKGFPNLPVRQKKGGKG
jgi:20S proteasome alpha/beta subunit